jgi:hypothetical protein
MRVPEVPVPEGPKGWHSAARLAAAVWEAQRKEPERSIRRVARPGPQVPTRSEAATPGAGGAEAVSVSVRSIR